MPEGSPINPTQWILPHIRKMHGYVPGKQTDDPEVIKLNTNENPFPVSKAVSDALVREIESARLQKYPDPVSSALRAEIARRYGKTVEHILVGNGSDEILSMLFRALLAPGHYVVTANPTYSLYPILADIVEAKVREVDLKADWHMDFQAMCSQEIQRLNPTLAIITNPNAPTGILEEKKEILEFSRAFTGLTLIDEAYIEFAHKDNASLSGEAGSDEFPWLMVSNTFSKSYSLAGQRIGWLIAHPELIQELSKIKDSYNVSRLAQTAALAAFLDTDAHKENIERIRKIRDDLTMALRILGFECLDSQSNFVFAKPNVNPAEYRTDDIPAKSYFDFLASRKIMIRYFPGPRTGTFVRISIGTEQQMRKLIECTKEFIAAR